ncbi:MAG: hypothetical protein A2017_16045 [Lentisphaerae bacterium GWF2_44_16]|nr:MAG: hypothetical protein A2017_16045 [Lentisphaerae bacterium GWF2_44_16]
MKVRYHITASLLVSGLLFWIFKSIPMTLISFISGVLIDVDHLLEYMISPHMKLDIAHFFKFFEKNLTKKAFLFFHSWELLAVLFVICWSSGWDLWIAGLLIGMAQHMILDQIFNPTSAYSYFFIWRMKNNFDFRICFSKAFKAGK